MKYLDITTCSVTDGKGFRLVLWTSGCEHHCEGCHNPQSWNADAGKDFTEETVKHILDELNHDYIYGLTLSGGDPLHPDNVYEVYKLCKTVKETYPDKKIWLYTGYNFNNFWIPKGCWITQDCNPTRDLRNGILQYTDVLVDGQYIHQQRDITLAFRGSSNQRLIDVQKTLKQNEVVLFED